MPVSKDEIVKHLNDALAYEYQAVMMYTTYAAAVSGIHRGELREFFQTEVADELGHAQFLADKIAALGGSPLTEARPFDVPETPRGMLEAVEVAETEAIERYTDLREKAEAFGDISLVNHLDDMITDETDHKEESQKLLKGSWEH